MPKIVDSRSIAIHRESLPSLAVLEREWRAQEHLVERGFFLSWAWIGTWLATLPPSVEPFLLRAKRGDASVGIALAVERSRALYLNATGDRDLDSIYIEHNGFLCETSAEHAVLDAVAAWFAEAQPPLEGLHLPGIAAPVRRGRLLDEAREAQGFATNLARVSETGGDVAAALGAKSRQQLRRALRAYETHGPLEISEATSLGEAQNYFDALKAFHIASWERRRRRHAFASPQFERFHRALIEREFANGAIQLLRVGVGDRAIGYLYNFRRNGIVYAYQSGFDDGHHGLSPGVVSHALALAHNAQGGERLYDFLAGANRLKENFASDRYRLYWQILRRPRLHHRLRAAVRRVKRKLAP